MADPGESHRRSRSAAALSLLRRKSAYAAEVKSSSDAAGASLALDPTMASVAAARHSSRSSMASTFSLPSPMRPSQPGLVNVMDSRGVSLEASVKKFRIVEALRNGDTAFISKAMHENAAQTALPSVSSLTTWAAGLDDTTILHLAIQCAEQAVVEFVLSDGAASIDVNAQDKDGNTPLHMAVMQGRSQLVRLLLGQKGINDSVANKSGRTPLDLARHPDIFQQLQLSRSMFADDKVRQVQDLLLHSDLATLGQVLEEPRFKTVLDINSSELVTDPLTQQCGGTLLHEAARRKNTALIQVLLLHGADPFRRDRKGKLAHEITRDDVVKAMLKRSPAAVSAQRSIQEKAVLGSATPGASSASARDPLAGREAREIKGYLKKWTNYRKGYQLRWFVLEDGVLSYYKHQDDAGSACRGAINMKIATLHMSPEERTKFEIMGKSSVKYTLKANHEVEAKRWFWALNNSIQWTKDQAKEELRQRARSAELLRQAKEHVSSVSVVSDPRSESPSLSDHRPSAKTANKAATGPSTAGRGPNDRDLDASLPADGGDCHGPATTDSRRADDDHGHDSDDDDSSGPDAPPDTTDAFYTTAQSARLQLEAMAALNDALVLESNRNGHGTVPEARASAALATHDAAIRSLTGLIGDLLRVSRERDAYWQHRLDRERGMRRMWEESMARIAQEHEALEARVGEAELKSKMTKRILREAMAGDDATASAPHDGPHRASMRAVSAERPRRRTIASQVADLSDSASDTEEFFDAVDAGHVAVAPMPPPPREPKLAVLAGGASDMASSFRGYENGVRTRLKMEADNRPKLSLWGILKSMVGKDMTKMALPVTFNEPTSLLYRCGEDMEYAHLLDLAADRTDPVERLIYVAAFAASEYASTIDRVAKPFNPLLGETFEYVRPDKNYRFFIEQVSHHPPVGAAWAESPKWTYYGESAVKSKFYGRSIDINPLGTWFLRLRPAPAGTEELYTWKKVTSSVVGIITGNPVVDNYGPMEIKNWTTGDLCRLDFKPRGWKLSSAYQITGQIVDAHGRVRVSMGGRWNAKIYARLTPGHEASIEEPADDHGSLPKETLLTSSHPNRAFLVWQANARPNDIPFNLTPFVLTFNHIDDTLRPWLAPTDSRLRPDQRAMEEGDYDFAATEKTRLEEAQRKRRREREARGEEFAPAWFARAKCDITGEEYWKFTGEYWKRRERAGPDGDPAVWSGLEAIF